MRRITVWDASSREKDTLSPSSNNIARRRSMGMTIRPNSSNLFAYGLFSYLTSSFFDNLMKKDSTSVSKKSTKTIIF